MDFYEVIRQAVQLLQHQGKLTYRTLSRQFDLDDEALKDLRDELLFSYPVVDENSQGLVWTREQAEALSSAYPETDWETRFHAALLAVIALLQRDGRVTYSTLKLACGLDDRFLAKLCEELRLRHLAIDEEGKVLAWTGEAHPIRSPLATTTACVPRSQSTLPEALLAEIADDQPGAASEPVRHIDGAERRQLTVMFCDLVGSTDLSGKLDPEDLRAVVRAYQETAAEVIGLYEGHIAQYLGDGLLIYFGFPVAHEDDAQRAVYTGLGIPEAIQTLNTQLEANYGVRLAVRIGIHTGPTVVGEMGGGGRHENLALGETPNIAARLESLAQPNTVVMSSVTAQLVQRLFILEELGPHDLKGVTESMMLFVVRGPRDPDPDYETFVMGGFEVLVGRDEEIGLLLRRWQQSKEGLGQVVLLSGEAGIGKSSLVEGLRRHVRQEGLTRIAFRCSPYHTNSAFYPIIEAIQRALNWQSDDTAETRLVKLEQALEDTHLALDETVPILASLLSLELPDERYPASTLSLPQQRQQTQDVLVAWLFEMAERQPVLAMWEDLHWADPSTLEVLQLCVEQAPTVAICQVLTFRPEFEPTWPTRSHLTPISLNRLERQQVEVLIASLAEGKALPLEVVDHIVSKTDGVPLYVEELTKALLQSDRLSVAEDTYVLIGPLNEVSIPATLQDSLMARLDQLGPAREIAQLGSVIGREFDYGMLQLLSNMEADVLDTGLKQLVEAELVFVRGRLPRAIYSFKHALIQDAAYQSLLRSRRQYLHQQIAELLETQFQDTVSVQPELIANHYTVAGQYPQAVSAWRQAGEQALARVAYREAAVSIENAIDALHQLPASQQDLELGIDLRLKSRNALFPLAKYDRVIERLQEAQVIAETLGDQRRLGQILTRMCLNFFPVPALDRALEAGRRALAIAETHAYDDIRAIASVYLSLCYQSQGNYQQAIDTVTPIVNTLAGDSAYDFFGLEVPPAVTGRSSLARSLSEIGRFTDAIVYGEEAIRIAEELGHPRTSNTVYMSTGITRLRRGDIVQAIPFLEQSVKICRDANIVVWFAVAASAMSCAYAHAGQMEQARQLLDEIPVTAAMIGSPILSCTVEAALLTGRLSYAEEVATRGLDMTRGQSARGEEAHLLRLLGNLARPRGTAAADRAESFYRQALDLACELGLRPLEAHCHRDLGLLCGERGEPELARQELDTATTLYREMEMQFWMPMVEDALSQLKGR